MKKAFSVLTIVLFLFSTNTHSFVKNVNKNKFLRGGVDGGGTELWGVGPSAWFLKDYKNQNSKRVIKYCYERSADFEIINADIEDIISEAFQKWKNYIFNKKINGIQDLKLETTSELVDCTGKEDLKFYFGVLNEEIAILLQRFENTPLAFAHRTKHFEKKGWSKGLIWFMPGKIDGAGFINWTKEKVLGTVIHELGHTLGIAHVEGTIMSSGFGWDLIWDTFLNDYPGMIINGVSIKDYSKVSSYRLSNIDYNNRLAVNINSNEKVVGQIWQRGSEIEKITFKKFMGREPVGKVESILDFPWSYTLGGDYQGTLTLGDTIGEKVLPFKFQKHTKAASSYRPLGVFRRVWHIDDQNTLEVHGTSDRETQTLVGFIKSSDNMKTTILFEYGLNSAEYGPKKGKSFLPTLSPYKLYYLEDGKKHLLFGQFFEL